MVLRFAKQPFCISPRSAVRRIQSAAVKVAYGLVLEAGKWKVLFSTDARGTSIHVGARHKDQFLTQGIELLLGGIRFQDSLSLYKVFLFSLGGLEGIFLFYSDPGEAGNPTCFRSYRRNG